MDGHVSRAEGGFLRHCVLKFRGLGCRRSFYFSNLSPYLQGARFFDVSLCIWWRSSLVVSLKVPKALFDQALPSDSKRD